jgi:uncharacterized protein YegP (UPF0339 family)
MASKYVIDHEPRKGYHFTLVATNGRVIATSEHYETRRACLAGIESVRRNAPGAEVTDRTSERRTAQKAGPTPSKARPRTGRSTPPDKTTSRSAEARGSGRSGAAPKR